jgi:hypothetical protein
VTCEELSSCKDELELQFMAKNLDKMDWFGSSDPFLQFSRANEAGNFIGTSFAGLPDFSWYKIPKCTNGP